MDHLLQYASMLTHDERRQVGSILATLAERLYPHGVWPVDDDLHALERATLSRLAEALLAAAAARPPGRQRGPTAGPDRQYPGGTPA